MLSSHDHRHLRLFSHVILGFQGVRKRGERSKGRERRGGGEEVESAETASCIFLLLFFFQSSEQTPKPGKIRRKVLIVKMTFSFVNNNFLGLGGREEGEGERGGEERLGMVHLRVAPLSCCSFLFFQFVASSEIVFFFFSVFLFFLQFLFHCWHQHHNFTLDVSSVVGAVLRVSFFLCVCRF